MRVETADAAIAAAKNGGCIWLHYNQTTKEELSKLSEPLGLHPLAIEDCFDENEIPKIEDYPQNTFILFNTFEYTNRELSIGEIDLFIGSNFLVTVSRSASENHRLFDELEHVVETNLQSTRQGPSYLMHIILDYVVDKKFAAIEALVDQLDTLEGEMLVDASRFDPTELIQFRRYLLSLRKSLFHEREILVRICRRDSPFVSEGAIYHFRDISDHLAKFFEAIEIYREMITSLMEIYLSVLNNRMTVVANRTNRIVRRLTLINTIFMPLTLLAGIGGMSEWSMMTHPQNWRVAYPAFLVLMLLIGIANYVLLKRLEARDRAYAEKDLAELDRPAETPGREGEEEERGLTKP